MALRSFCVMHRPAPSPARGGGRMTSCSSLLRKSGRHGSRTAVSGLQRLPLHNPECDNRHSGNSPEGIGSAITRPLFQFIVHDQPPFFRRAFNMPIEFEAGAIETYPAAFMMGVSQHGQCMAQRVQTKAAPPFQKLLMLRNPVVDFCFVLSFPPILLLNLAF
jgi:hypothetical protein